MVELYNAPKNWPMSDAGLKSIIKTATVFSGAHLSNDIKLSWPSATLAKVMKEDICVICYHWTFDQTLNHPACLRQVRSDGLRGRGETQDDLLHDLP